QSSAGDYNAALKAHGLSNEYRSFAVNYIKNGTTWPIYIRLYTPAPLAATEFSAARTQIPGPARAAPNPTTAGPNPHTPPPPVTPAKPPEDDYTWVAVVIGLIVLGVLGWVTFLYMRPIQMEVEKEPLTLNRGEEAAIYGPDSKPDRKGIALK